jgi:SAM-dependent methyltransferase
VNCRHCGSPLSQVAIDLGHQPPSNAYLSREQLDQLEVYAPLKVLVCESCWLVQLPALHRAEELFTSEYAYFSSVSSSWVAHARSYVKEMIERFRIGKSSFVVEVASNDGYLLQFVKEAGIRCLGIEPTASTAAVARSRGIESLEIFFDEGRGREIARERGFADLIAANNVLAHVPDINGFVAGFRELLANSGVATFEFPHVMRLVDGGQFDTIYHEHYSYLSLTTVKTIFESQGLRVFDVEEIPTHGGSLRVFACRKENLLIEENVRVEEMLRRELERGLLTFSYYENLKGIAERVKFDLLAFLLEERKRGSLVAAYGAAAKGNTLLNYAGVKADLIPYVCDAAPSKQGRFLPGSHIPILAPEELLVRRPDVVVILPWNIRKEIVSALGYIRDWGGRMAVAVPRLEIE